MKKNKGFFTLLFTSLSIILILITYSAVQQQKQIKSKAATTGQCVNRRTDTSTEELSNVQIKMKISLQGITANYPPEELTDNVIHARILLVNEKSGKQEKDPVTFQANQDRTWTGTAEFEKLDVSQRYYVLIKPKKHIQKKICDLTPQDPPNEPGYYSCRFGKFVDLKEGLNEFDFSGIRILAGDLQIGGTQDGNINAEDLGTLKNLIDKDDSQITDEDLKVADLDLNGKVEAHDWSLMIESLEVKYDEK